VTWWGWVLLWTALAAGSAGLMSLIARSLWRKSMALFDELGTAADRLAVLDQELSTLAERSAPSADLAVFADPTELRQARIQATWGGPAPVHRPRHRASALPPEPGGARAR
jgi:hypothetical protein